jgi:hypothetical protein
MKANFDLKSLVLALLLAIAAIGCREPAGRGLAATSAVVKPADPVATQSLLGSVESDAASVS